MITAFFKLGLITIASLILAVFAVFFVRQMGLQQSFSAPHHPWFDRSFWWVYTPNTEELCASTDIATRLPGPEWIVAVPIVRNNEEWDVACPHPVPIAQFLQGSHHKDWILQISARDTWSLDQLVSGISALEKDRHFAVVAESQKVSLYLRKKAPEWLYAADSSSLLRFRTFESLWIETALDFWPDFLVVSSGKNTFALDPRGATELKRRGKRILWNWNENMGLKPPDGIQGILTNRPIAAQQIFGARL